MLEINPVVWERASSFCKDSAVLWANCLHPGVMLSIGLTPKDQFV